MINNLEKTIEVLKKINDYLVEKKVPEVLVEQQIIRLKQSGKALKDYSALVNNFQKSKITQENTIECLGRVHSNLMGFINDIDQVDELLTLVLKEVYKTSK